MAFVFTTDKRAWSQRHKSTFDLYVNGVRRRPARPRKRTRKGKR